MKKYINIKYLLVAVLLGFIPSGASAATVYLQSSRSTISVGDTAIVAVKVNAEGGVLNTVEGDISIASPKGSLLVQEFSLANSSFGLWPRTPSLSKDGHTVSFVGGVPGGFSIEGATLFNVIVEAKKEGTITLNPQNILAYANDGKGTKVPVALKGITINIVPSKEGTPSVNEWAAIVSGDTVPPEDFIVVPGQDKALFSGKKFVFFSAVDNQSGIDYYNVSENGAPAVRSGSTYVLQDQSDNVVLNVTAYDKAGNKKVSTYTGKASSGKPSWVFIILLIVLIGAIWRVYRVWKRAKNASSK